MRNIPSLFFLLFFFFFFFVLILIIVKNIFNLIIEKNLKIICPRAGLKRKCGEWANLIPQGSNDNFGDRIVNHTVLP